MASMDRVNKILELRIRQHGLIEHHRILIGGGTRKPHFVEDFSRASPLPRLHGAPSVDFHGRRMGVTI